LNAQHQGYHRLAGNRNANDGISLAQSALIRTQILQQAGSTMLAQAKSIPQSVLQRLQSIKRFPYPRQSPLVHAREFFYEKSEPL